MRVRRAKAASPQGGCGGEKTVRDEKL